MFKYYSISRPIMPGSFPRRAGIEIVNFDKKIFCEEIERKAWGYIEYPERLTEKEADDYELISTEQKTFWCVSSSVFSDGTVKAAIVSTKKAIKKPENEYMETPLKDIYVDWFETEEEAKDFLKDAQNA